MDAAAQTTDYPLGLGLWNERAVMLVVASGVGFIACQWHFTYVLTSVVVYFWLVAHSRYEAAAIMALYTVFSTWVVVPAIVDYLTHSFLLAVGIWMLGIAVVMLPWFLLYRHDSKYVELRLAALLILTTVPPVGYFQFASPFVGTSLLIPGHGFLSIALGVVVVCLVSRCVKAKLTCPRVSIIGVVILSVFGMGGGEYGIDGWVSVDTSVNVGGVEHTIVGSMSALQEARRFALRTEAKVVILGESTGGFSVDAGSMVLSPAQDGSVIVAGGRKLNKQSLFIWDGERSYIAYEQRVRPMLLGHMDNSPDGNITTEINGVEVAPLICYEGAITWGLFTAMAEKPEHLVSVANFYWSRNSDYFSRVLRAHVIAWGNIFGIGTTIAVNGSV